MPEIPQKRGQFRRACAFAASLALALIMVLPLSAAAVEPERADEAVTLPSGLELTLLYQDEPLLERMLLGGLTQECYYLTLDGEVLVCADEME